MFENSERPGSSNKESMMPTSKTSFDRGFILLRCIFHCIRLQYCSPSWSFLASWHFPTCYKQQCISSQILLIAAQSFCSLSFNGSIFHPSNYQQWTQVSNECHRSSLYTPLSALDHGRNHFFSPNQTKNLDNPHLRVR